MQKKIIFMFAIAVIAVALAFNAITNSNKTALSAVTLSNVEALTQGEIWVGTPCTYDPEWDCRWDWPDGTFDYMEFVRPI